MGAPPSAPDEPQAPGITLARRLEPAAGVGGDRRHVDRGLGIRGEDDEHVAAREAAQREARLQGRQRACEPPSVDGALHNACMIAAVLESGDLRRLYTGLSLLVASAVDGTPARALAMFAALGPLLDDDLGLAAMATPGIAEDQLEAFARTLVELRDAALVLGECRVWACAAAVELTGTDRALAGDRLAGVISTPQFLREVQGARLVVV